MGLGVRLARRLDFRKSPTVTITTAAIVLLIYAVVMLWPYLVATLVRGSTVTAWTHLATAPILGRAPATLPLVGSQVAVDGVIMELVNDLLDPSTVHLSEAALASTKSRTAASTLYLESVRELDNERRDLMKRHAANYRAELDDEIATREARVAHLEIKVASVTAIAGRTRSISDGGYRSRDYHDDSLIRRAEADADLAAERMALDRAKRRRTASYEGLFLAPDGS